MAPVLQKTLCFKQYVNTCGSHVCAIHSRNVAKILNSLLLADVLEQQGPSALEGTGQQHQAFAAHVAAELEATSQLVHDQSLQQAELLQVTS